MPKLRTVIEVTENKTTSLDMFDKGFQAAKKGKEAKFLIIRNIGWGDVLLTVSAMKSMYDYYGGVKLYLSTSEDYREVIERLPWIAGTFNVEEELPEKFVTDLTVDLREKFDYLPICNTAHRLDIIHSLLSIPVKYGRFLLQPEIQEIEKAFYLIADRGGLYKDRYTIGVHYSSYADIRTWDWAEEFVQMTYDSGYNVITLQDSTVNMLNVSSNGNNHVGLVRTHGGGIGISGLLGLLYWCDIVVCPDSGVMHTCGMMEKPFVALFGSIPPKFRDFYYINKRSLFLRDLFCTPCYDFQVYCCRDTPKFKKCLHNIFPEAVLVQVDSLLREVRTYVAKERERRLDVTSSSLHACFK